VSRWFRSYGFADVYDDLIVGAYPLDPDDVDVLARMGIRRVMNVCEDREYPPGDREQVARALTGAGIAESRLPLTDYGGLPAGDLESAVRAVGGWLDDGQPTYVHCRAGWQRSAAIAAGVVAARTGMDVDDAVEYVRRRKPSADPLPHQRADLRRWWEGRREAEPGADEPIPGDGEPTPGAGGTGAGDQASSAGDPESEHESDSAP
jgi:protein-tyrosine phosphatase